MYVGKNQYIIVVVFYSFVATITFVDVDGYCALHVNIKKIFFYVLCRILILRNDKLLSKCVLKVILSI